MKSLRIIFVDQLSSDNPTLEGMNPNDILSVSYTHLRAHETR